MRLRSRAIIGVAFVLAGVLIIADGLVSGPHAFAAGWLAVGGLVVAGVLLLIAGGSILHEMRRTV